MSPEQHFEFIYGTYRLRLLGFVGRYVAVDGEDIVEDTFMRAWIHREKLVDMKGPQGRDATFAWLARVARNLVTDRARRRRYQQTSLLEVHSGSCSNGPMERAADRLDMAAGMSCLTSEQRSVIEMRFFHDKPVAQVAEALQITQEVAKKRQERGVRSLARYVGGEAAAA